MTSFDPFVYGKIVPGSIDLHSNSESVFFRLKTDSKELGIALLSDRAAHDINERIIPQVDAVEKLKLQSNDEAKSILWCACAEENKDKYVLVFSAQRFGITFHHLILSDVPGYAYFAYSDSTRSESERETIRHACRLLEENEHVKFEASRKFVAIVNGELVSRFFRSISEINSCVKRCDTLCYFCVGVFEPLHNATCYFRSFSQTRPIKLG